ncbi:hypothetical protein M446_5415 [Methylobacterium sp. 4-46]|nr:hypothetical protein M446_5415 [Methylobacterium sp. 4-46]
MTDAAMPSTIIFEAIKSASCGTTEDSQLVWADRALVALLVPAGMRWYLQMGLGPCDREGLLFDTLEAARDWVQSCLDGGAIRTAN